ncbi:MAG: hypothetical protein Q4A16_04750 [Lautropia sp.]|nr:hypothetical protein [Lautropia sp.]
MIQKTIDRSKALVVVCILRGFSVGVVQKKTEKHGFFAIFHPGRLSEFLVMQAFVMF